MQKATEDKSDEIRSILRTNCHQQRQKVMRKLVSRDRVHKSAMNATSFDYTTEGTLPNEEQSNRRVKLMAMARRKNLAS